MRTLGLTPFAVISQNLLMAHAVTSTPSDRELVHERRAAFLSWLVLCDTLQWGWRGWKVIHIPRDCIGKEERDSTESHAPIP